LIRKKTVSNERGRNFSRQKELAAPPPERHAHIHLPISLLEKRGRGGVLNQAPAKTRPGIRIFTAWSSKKMLSSVRKKSVAKTFKRRGVDSLVGGNLFGEGGLKTSGHSRRGKELVGSRSLKQGGEKDGGYRKDTKSDGSLGSRLKERNVAGRFLREGRVSR